MDLSTFPESNTSTCPTKYCEAKLHKLTESLLAEGLSESLILDAFMDALTDIAIMKGNR